MAVMLSSTVYADYTIGTVNYRDQFVFESGSFDCNAINYQTGYLTVLANTDQINRADGFVNVCIEGDGTIYSGAGNTFGHIESKCYTASDFKQSDRILLGFPAVDNTYSGQCNATYKAGFVNPMLSNSPNWNIMEKIFDIYSNQRTCAQKFVCVTQSNSAYQHSDCSYSNLTSCSSIGCNQADGLCNIETIPIEPPIVQPPIIQPQRTILSDIIDFILNVFRSLGL